MQMIDGGGAHGWGPHECCGPYNPNYASSAFYSRVLCVLHLATPVCPLYTFSISGRQLQVPGLFVCLSVCFFGVKVILKSKANDNSSCGGEQETIVTWSSDFAHVPAVIHHRKTLKQTGTSSSVTSALICDSERMTSADASMRVSCPFLSDKGRLS